LGYVKLSLKMYFTVYYTVTATQGTTQLQKTQHTVIKYLVRSTYTHTEEDF